MSLPPYSSTEFIPLSHVEYVSEENTAHPPILFIHGMSSSKETWGHILPALKDSYNVYAIDLQGHGESPLGGDEALSLDKIVADIHHFVTEKGLTNFFLVAHSMGVRVAISYAASFSDQVKGLFLEDMEILVRPPPSLIPEDVEKLKLFRQTQPSHAKAEEELLKFGYSTTKIESFNSKGRIKEMASGGVYIGASPYTDYLIQRDIQTADSVMPAFERLRERAFPMVFLQAETDSAMSEEGTEHIRSILPDVKIVKIAHSSHCIHKSAKDEFLRQLGIFLLASAI
jgi:pimeloyl-ACP methyl ester carboxylesterase